MCMKAIENISENLQKIFLKGLELHEKTSKINLFHAEIDLYKVGDSIFVLFHHLKPFTDKKAVSLYEIRSAESYYLFDTIKSILENLDEYGPESYDKNVFKTFSDTIKFCKKVGFECSAFETALNKLDI